jgi:hypothetical protein
MISELKVALILIGPPTVIAIGCAVCVVMAVIAKVL